MDGAGVAGAALADRTVTNARGADMGDDHLGPLSGGTDTARHVRADGSINGDAASDKGSNASEGRAGPRSDTHIRRTMTTRERLFLKPWEKTTRFGRFPGKLVLDLLLTVLVTSQIVISNVQSAASYRAAHRNWLYLFFPEDYDFSDPTTYLYTPNASIDAIERAVTNYYHVNNVSLDTFQYVPHSTTASPVPLAVTKYRAGGPKFWAGDVEFNSALESHVWLLSPDNLGPVDPSRYSHSDIVSFFSSVQTMTAYYALQSYQLGPLYRNCLVWNISVEYDFSNRGEFEVSLHDHVIGDCGGADKWYINALSATVLALCVFHQVLLLRSIYRHLTLVLQLRRFAKRRRLAAKTPDVMRPLLAQHPEVGWDDLSCSDKMSFMNVWFVLGSLANVLGGVAAAIDIEGASTNNPTQLWRNLALGTAAALRCVCLLRYLAHNRSYYTLVLTLSRAVPRVLRFLLGVLPIFFAYSLFAVVVFGDQVEQFGSLWGSMVTLFAVLNGDVIRDTFMSLEVDHFIVGQVFMYSFVSLFIFCCLNVTIALVEEAFFFTAERSAELERTRAALEASTQPPRHSDDGSARRGQAQPAGTATSQSSAGDGVRELPVATDSHAVELGLHATRQAGLADEFKHDGGEGSPADAPATARSTQLSAVARLLSAKDIDDHARIANRS